MQSLIARARAAALAVYARFEAWWRGEQSTLVGAIAVLSGIFTSTSGASALHDLGIAEGWIKHVASVLIIAGLTLVTPKDRHP